MTFANQVAFFKLMTKKWNDWVNVGDLKLQFHKSKKKDVEKTRIDNAIKDQSILSHAVGKLQFPNQFQVYGSSR